MNKTSYDAVSKNSKLDLEEEEGEE